MLTKKSLLLTLTIISYVSVVSFAQRNSEAVNKNVDVNTTITWTAKYISAYPNDPHGHFYGRKALTEILSIQNIKKVIVFHGMDNSGIRLVFKAADEKGDVLPFSKPYDNGFNCPPYCPKAFIDMIGSTIDEGYAQQLILKFQDTHKSRVKAHLFDKASFEMVLAQEGVEGMYFGNAINDSGDQIMVLAGVDTHGSVMWDGVVITTGIPIPAFESIGYPEQIVAAKK